MECSPCSAFLYDYEFWPQEFNTVGNGDAIYNYQRWYNPGKKKQKLTIGGIFPITGDKFNAPELLPGEMFCTLKPEVQKIDTNYHLQGWAKEWSVGLEIFCSV